MHLSVSVTHCNNRYINAIPIIHDANWTAAFGHAPRSDNFTVTGRMLRHEPILSMFAMPFPLVCSVVAVVSCSRNKHIMVLTPFHEFLCMMIHAKRS